MSMRCSGGNNPISYITLNNDKVYTETSETERDMSYIKKKKNGYNKCIFNFVRQFQ